MPIDIRGLITATIGGASVKVIDFDCADDSIEDNAVIKTKGGMTIEGTYSFARGSIIEIGVQFPGGSYSVPRRLIVLASIANPFKRITQVEMGCPYTYLENKQPAPGDAVVSVREPNPGVSDEEYCKIGASFDANWLLGRATQRLGIAAPPSILSNKYRVDEWNFSSGYLDNINDLLRSEAKYTQIAADGSTRGGDLGAEASYVGAAITEDQIIDLEPTLSSSSIEDFGETVYVSIPSLTFKKPKPELTDSNIETIENVVYEISESTGFQSIAYVISNPSSPPGLEPETYEYPFTPQQITVTEFEFDDDGQQRVKRRGIMQTLNSAEAAGAYYQYRANKVYTQGGDNAEYYTVYAPGTLNPVQVFKISPSDVIRPFPPGGGMYIDFTLEEYEYDEFGDVIEFRQEKWQEEEVVIGAVNVPDIWYKDLESLFKIMPIRVIKKDDVIRAMNNPKSAGVGGDSRVTERIITKYEYSGREEDEEQSGNSQKTIKEITERYLNYLYTQNGQQWIARLGQDASDEAKPLAIQEGVSLLKIRARRRPELIGVSESISIKPNAGKSEQEKDDCVNKINSDWQDGPSTKELTVGTNYGDGIGTTVRISVPLGPDDELSLVGDSIAITPCNWQNAAITYAVANNEIKRGIKDGYEIQASPLNFPRYALELFYVSVNGLTIALKVNNWAIRGDKDGTICSCNGLYVGPVGASPDYDATASWAPIPPGVIKPGEPVNHTLPAEPIPVVDPTYGQIYEPSYIVNRYELLIEDSSIVRLEAVYDELSYAPILPTQDSESILVIEADVSDIFEQTDTDLIVVVEIDVTVFNGIPPPDEPVEEPEGDFEVILQIEADISAPYYYLRLYDVEVVDRQNIEGWFMTEYISLWEATSSSSRVEDDAVVTASQSPDVGTLADISNYNSTNQARWNQPLAAPFWIQWDWTAFRKVEILRFIINEGSSNIEFNWYTILRFQVQVSQDAVTWETITHFAWYGNYDQSFTTPPLKVLTEEDFNPAEPPYFSSIVTSSSSAPGYYDFGLKQIKFFDENGIELGLNVLSGVYDSVTQQTVVRVFASQYTVSFGSEYYVYDLRDDDSTSISRATSITIEQWTNGINTNWLKWTGSNAQPYRRFYFQPVYVFQSDPANYPKIGGVSFVGYDAATYPISFEILRLRGTDSSPSGGEAFVQHQITGLTYPGDNVESEIIFFDA